MTQRLYKLTIYDQDPCELCGTEYDCSPRGMYRHVTKNSDGVITQDRVVCNTCVKYNKNKHLFIGVKKIRPKWRPTNPTVGLK